MRTNRRPAALRGLLVAFCLASPVAFAQTTVSPGIATPEPPRPDACRLMPLSDLEALYPGKAVTARGPSLSPISRGPQYVEGCQYSARLPSATSPGDVSRFFSLAVVRFGGDPAKDAAESFASLKRLRETVGADPKIRLKIEPIEGVGQEAFVEDRGTSLAIVVRKDDLVFTVSADVHAEDTRRNALALAGQAASRWRGGEGVVERKEPVARNEAVAVPPDTRQPSVAPGDAWPDACALLTMADMRAVFPGATLKEPRAMTGKIRHEGREQKTETLPKPIACLFDVRRKVEGQQVFHIAQVALKNVAATPELSKRFYDVSAKVVGPLSPLAGLGEEAGIDALNRITVRKGLYAIEVKVTGGERDRTLHAEARERALELARIAAGRLP